MAFLDIIEKIKPKLEKYGYDVGVPLGMGSNGIAMSLLNHNDRVLKMTKDVSEANAASAIVGKNLKHVYKVFEVFKLKSNPGWYFIICERLKEVNLDAFEGEIEYWSTSNIDFKIQELGGISALPKQLKQIASGLQELQSVGISFHDVHSGNIMKRNNGDLVFIDLGMSQGPKGNIKIYEKENSKMKFTKIINEQTSFKENRDYKVHDDFIELNDDVKDNLEELIDSKRFSQPTNYGHGHFNWILWTDALDVKEVAVVSKALNIVF